MQWSEKTYQKITQPLPVDHFGTHSLNPLCLSLESASLIVCGLNKNLHDCILCNKSINKTCQQGQNGSAVYMNPGTNEN